MMSNTSCARVALSCALLLGAGIGAAAPMASDPTADADPAAIHAQVDSGQKIFATSCANCHGAGAHGAIGPALADRNLASDLIRTTVINGRVGTPMPAFKDALDGASLAAVMAYVESVTSNGQRPTAVIAAAALAGGASPLNPSSEPVAVGTERGVPARGYLVFFDATRANACRSCHTYANRGGPIGPDLAVKALSTSAVYEAISQPRLAAADYPAVDLTLRDGTRVSGIKSEETATTLVVYDVSSIPPVERTLEKSSIAARAAHDKSGIYDHTALGLTKQDRLDVAAYVGKPAGR